MSLDLFNRVPESLGRKLHHNHMELLGIEDTMRLAYSSNLARSRRQDDLRQRLYREELHDLLAENGPVTRTPITMKDGWAIDESMTLPHLDRILEDADRIIAERAGKRITSEGAYRSYFQDVWNVESDPTDYPSYLDFATSSDLMATVSHYLESIPALSTTLPSGIRFVESNTEFDDQPDNPHDSQLYHIDYYSLPNVYVLVLLQDTTFENGPWTFLPRGVSQEVREKLGYWKQGRGYRLSDEEVYSVASRDDVIEFTGKRGTVLFIESSGCMHFGSRNSVKPRFQLMLGYTGAIRTDFSESFMPPKIYPIRDEDSRLRKLVLDKSLVAVPDMARR